MCGGVDRVCVHAGEEGPVEGVGGALRVLGGARVDHGLAVAHALGTEDTTHRWIVTELRERHIGMTLCPLSNLRLRVVGDLADYPIDKFLKEGLYR